jgi:serine protease Do
MGRASRTAPVWPLGPASGRTRRSAPGFPFSDVLSDEPKVSTGIVSALSGVANNVNNLQHTAPINPGNSGGPLLDGLARIIGVNNARLAIDGQQNTNFAIHGAVVTQLLDSLGVAYSRVAGGTPAAVPDIARRANGFTVKILCHA